MSSAVTPAITPRPAGRTARTSPRRLRLVEPDERGCPDAVVCPEVRGGRPDVRGGRPDGRVCPGVHDDQDGWATPGDWAGGSTFATTRQTRQTRLTRRGRLVVTIVAMVALAALAVVLATSVDAGAPQVDHATTVLAGQTLSEVAAVQLPNLPIHQAVAQIQLLNGLNTSQVRAGQSLLIPSMP